MTKTGSRCKDWRRPTVKAGRPDVGPVARELGLLVSVGAEGGLGSERLY